MKACDEIEELKEVRRQGTLKVIPNRRPENCFLNIKKALSFRCIQAQTFIKTSTGKRIRQQPEAAYDVM